MRQFSTAKAGGPKKEYPPTHKIEPGKSAVFIPVERREATTDYGLKTVYSVKLLGDPEGVLKSIWWPKRAPEPPILTPVRLIRHDERTFILEVPETDEEKRSLWPASPPL